MRIRFRAWLLTMVVVCFGYVGLAWAADDPTLEYSTIETPHFYVHYYSGLEDFAWRVAINCEEAHAMLSPLLDWTPASKTHVNVVDRADSANGSAGTFGRNRMTIFAMPPEADSVLGFYDDWIRVLVYHEYVHILHIDTVHGLPGLLNRLVGKQYHPNQTLPRWYIEGIATYHESMRTRGGRVKGPTWNMWSRTAALEGTLFDLGATTGTPTAWPMGSSSYLYGSLFIDYVTGKYGEDWITRFNHIYGGRILPYSLNRTSREISGQTVEELWHEWQAHAHGKAHAERVAVLARGATPIETIKPGDGVAKFVRARPGGDTLTYYSRGLRSEPALVEINRSGEHVDDLRSIEGGYGAGSWTPDGETFVFSQSEGFKNLFFYQDLYSWHQPTGRLQRLTRGERAREPSVSPDGKRLAYVRNLHGTMELVVTSFENPSRDQHVVISGDDYPSEDLRHWNQISLPRWSPDSQHVVFSMWRLEDGFRDIWMATPTPDGTTLRRLTKGFAIDVDPVFGPEGRVYFSSDRTGIFNIFAVDPETRKVWQISNVVTGVTAPWISQDGQRVWVTHYTSKGDAIARFAHPEDPVEFEAASVRDAIPPIQYPTVDTSDFEVGTYKPWKWLAPLIFTPELGLVTSGSAFGATVSSNDPVNRHSWQLTAASIFAEDLADQSTNVAASYTYGGLPVDLSLLGRFSEFPRLRTYFAANAFQPYLQEQYVGQLSASYSLRSVSESVSIGLSFRVDHQTFSDIPRVEPEPGDPSPSEPFEGWFNELRLSLSFSNAERYSQSVSIEKGVTASISASVEDPAWGADYQSFGLTYTSSAYLPNPWLERHVLSLSWSGGHLATSERSPGAFSLGGNRPQDILSTLLFQDAELGRVIRGYQPGVARGPNYQLYQLDYRFPIVDLDEGFATIPIFFRRLKGSVFAEAGSAYDGFIVDQPLLSSVGAELLLTTTLGYYFTGNLRAGYARGLSLGGIHEFYLLYGGGF